MGSDCRRWQAASNCCTATSIPPRRLLLLLLLGCGGAYVCWPLTTKKQRSVVAPLAGWLARPACGVVWCGRSFEGIVSHQPELRAIVRGMEEGGRGEGMAVWMGVRLVCRLAPWRRVFVVGI